MAGLASNRRLAPLALALALAVLTLLPAADSRAAVPGVSVNLTWGVSRAVMDREIALLKRTGVRWVRMTMAWNGVEPYGPGRYDERYLSDMDYAVGQARAAGLNVLMPITDGVPFWASADPKRRRSSSGRPEWDRYWRPRDFRDYARFAAFVAGRYAPLGVHAYEVWNEPNLERFWPSGPDPRAYAGMLRAAYPAIKRADPRSTVVLGGLYQNGDPFLSGVYAAGAGDSFDAVGDHFYPTGDPSSCARESAARPSPDSLCGVANVQKVMAQNGDGGKPLWITEFGWSTFGDGVSEAQQARYLSIAFARIAREFPRVKVAIAYNLRNNFWQRDDSSNREANYGLLRTDFSAKPALLALEQAASGLTDAHGLRDAITIAIAAAGGGPAPTA